MASQSRIHTSRALQTAAKLRPFVLSNVTPTGKMLGEGSYGFVEELNMNGLVCAGKRIYEMLIEAENEGADRMVEKYYDECQLLSSLRHPNIVQFLGICFLETQSISTTDLKLPVLVMEMLQGSLDHLLENTPNIPLAKKCSILQDVARGLVYLHNRSPAVIHRDLTARNVLLNSAMVAKIADMGNSRIIQPSQLFKTMTRIPGTLVYMPPEAQGTSSKYDTSLDMFSFGHLALFTTIQEFPSDILPPTFEDDKTKKVIGRNEIERRGKYIEILESKFGVSHALVQLIKQCLEYSTKSRPSASDALQRLQYISSKVDDRYHEMTRLQLEQQIKQLELEAMEGELLQELKKMKGVAGKQLKPATTKNYVVSKGIKYNIKQGDIGGNTIDVMILVSVGSEFPVSVQVQPRVRDAHLAEKAIKAHGHLPSFVTGLHKEAAADLMATASQDLKSSNVDIVRICLDVPEMQRSKEYYIKTIAKFFKTSQQPVVAIDYLGHSEEDTGNWCFQDGTISYREILDLYKEHCPGKLLTIQSDCCYSGKWAVDCAKALDNLGIHPCGHRAREQGILLRVFASCQADQHAAEPGYSMEAMLVDSDGTAMNQTMLRLHQNSTWFSGTKLVCFRGPDVPCPKNTFAQLKWEDGIGRRFPVKTVTRTENGKDMWYCLMLHKAGKDYERAFDAQIKKNPALKLSDWGYVLETGEGHVIPPQIQEKKDIWTTVAT